MARFKEKKAKKQASASSPSKQHIVFDAAARRYAFTRRCSFCDTVFPSRWLFVRVRSSDYLLGMSKRKQARRKYGHDLQKLKDRRELLDARKEVRLHYHSNQLAKEQTRITFHFAAATSSESKIR